VRLVLVGDVFRPEVAGVDVEQAIRSDRVTRYVSVLAPFRRPDLGERAPAEGGGGSGRWWRIGRCGRGRRDIGTVVFPEAPLKIFLTATPDERARRRLFQRGEALDVELVRRESQALAARDAADSNRRIAPLKPAPEAVLLDTTTLTLEQQVTRVVELARGLFPG